MPNRGKPCAVLDGKKFDLIVGAALWPTLSQQPHLNIFLLSFWPNVYSEPSSYRHHVWTRSDTCADSLFALILTWENRNLHSLRPKQVLFPVTAAVFVYSDSCSSLLKSRGSWFLLSHEESWLCCRTCTFNYLLLSAHLIVGKLRFRPICLMKCTRVLR